MSQRTRTADGEPNKRPARARRTAEAAPSAPAPSTAPITPPSVPNAPEPSPTTPLSLAPDGLARVLRAVADELERDPTLAARVAAAVEPEMPAPESTPPSAPSMPTQSVPSIASLGPAEPPESAPPTPRRGGRTFRPRIVTGAAPELGTGIPDPFALRQKLGETGLRKALDELRLGTLRAIVREHHLDPTGRLKGVNDERKYRTLILAATRAQ